jgi:predicted metal-dependent hydrolase
MLSWTIVKRRLRIKVQKPKNTSYALHKESARALIVSRLESYNQENQFAYNRVAIRDQKRCWGSCSSKGNLNFSYKLLFLPACLRDYIIVHELCHLRVLNHSASFWKEVEVVMPDFKERMMALRTIEKTTGTSLIALKKHQREHTCLSCEQERVLLK